MDEVSKQSQERTAVATLPLVARNDELRAFEK
jgi:hypothetical protein